MCYFGNDLCVAYVSNYYFFSFVIFIIFINFYAVLNCGFYSLLPVEFESSHQQVAFYLSTYLTSLKFLFNIHK